MHSGQPPMWQEHSLRRPTEVLAAGDSCPHRLVWKSSRGPRPPTLQPLEAGTALTSFADRETEAKSGPSIPADQSASVGTEARLSGGRAVPVTPRAGTTGLWWQSLRPGPSRHGHASAAV